MQSQEANKTTRRSARRSVVENSLTEPTLLEMSGNPTNRELSDLSHSRFVLNSVATCFWESAVPTFHHSR